MVAVVTFSSLWTGKAPMERLNAVVHTAISEAIWWLAIRIATAWRALHKITFSVCCNGGWNKKYDEQNNIKVLHSEKQIMVADTSLILWWENMAEQKIETRCQRLLYADSWLYFRFVGPTTCDKQPAMLSNQELNPSSSWFQLLKVNSHKKN